MLRSARQISLCAALSIACGTPTVQAADPILMMLLSVAQEMIIAAARQKSASPVIPMPLIAERYPGTTVEPAQLRQLIDECFVYLSAAQRMEIFDSLHAALSNPRSAATHGATIDFFASRAHAVRDAQRRLAGLSGADRHRLLAEFRVAVAAMPPEEAAQIGELLRRRVLPLPGELNAQLLAALEAHETAVPAPAR